jgi:hypothetical protein
MNKDLFIKLMHGVREYDSYFVMKKDTIGVFGFLEIKKCTTAMRLLAYGAPNDTHDNYLCMAESMMRHGVDDVCHRPVGNPKRKV